LTAVVVIGVGNTYRRDDGIGPAVAVAVESQRLPGVRVVQCAMETTALLDAWDGAAHAVVVDAAAGGIPGRVRHCGIDDFVEDTAVSSHELGLRQAHELAQVLGRAPGSIVVVTVDVADTGYGDGLSPAVAQALPEAVRVVGEQIQKACHQLP
jgi:hydrogenase maturation protease